jgi:DDE_Tnp_1-associated
MSSSLVDAVRPGSTAGIDVSTGLNAERQRDLLHALTAVPDPRHRSGVRYRLASLLAVAVCAVLAGATTFAAIADWGHRPG